MSDTATPKRFLEPGENELLRGSRLKKSKFDSSVSSPSSSGYLTAATSFSGSVQSGSDDVGEPQSDIICFGMLCGLQVQFYSVPQHEKLVEQCTDTSAGGLLHLVVVLLEDHGEIRTENGTTVAQLNRKTHLALRQLQIDYRICYNALISPETLKNKLSAAYGHTNSRSAAVTCTADALVSGPRSAADTVAKVLGQYSLFLQHPYPYTTTLEYHNPQYFDISGASFSVGTFLPPLSAEVMRDAGLQSLRQNDDVNNYHDNLDPWKALDELATPVGLREVDSDARIKTELLGHQKEGVHFITRRESLDFPQPSLWEPRTGETTNQALIYQHRVTGARRPTPEDIQGGLLADDMGLGKTLMMIASIVATLTSANQYAGSRARERHSSATTGLVPVKSTLVLVPSVLLMDVWSSQLEQPIAHVIRNWSTKQFTAVDGLSTNIRWCMTGTPIQNTVDDLGSLIKFLRVPIFRNKADFRKHISSAYKNEIGYARPNIQNLKILLGTICLRRNKSILDLPGVTEVKHQPRFSGMERLAYDGLLAACHNSIKAAVSHAGKGKSHRPILEGLLRLRMFCNVGLKLGRGKDGAGISAPDQLLSLLQQGGTASCSSCGADISTLDDGDGAQRPRLSHCLRVVCGECAPRFLAQCPASGDGCSICGKEAEGEFLLDSTNSLVSVSKKAEQDVSDGEHEGIWPSKLRVVMDDLSAHLDSDKSIVFSFWRQSLDVTGHLLEQRGIRYGRVDGLLKPSQRKKVLRNFCSDLSMRVLLMTLGTGGTGLNDLSIASRVHFLEPQWNPSIESQAIGRVLRLGQEKQVCIVRYIMEDSIEKSVEDRQMTKIQLALASGLHSDERNSRDRRRRGDKQLLELQKVLGLRYYDDAS